MSKSISSLPGAAKFRSIVVIIIVLICISVFLTFTNNLSDKVEIIDRDQVIVDIQHSLSMMLYDFAVKKKISEVEKFVGTNPFYQLEIYRSLPGNYHGESPHSLEIKGGWYFNTKKLVAVYMSRNGDIANYKMYLVKEDGITRLAIKQEKVEIN